MTVSISRSMTNGDIVEMSLKFEPPARPGNTVATVSGFIKAGGQRWEVSGGAHTHNLDEFLSLFRVTPAGK